MAKRKRRTSNESVRGKRSREKKTAHGKDAPIPVTLLSGFLGSGKTTLLKHVLTSKEHKLKIAVIVNDMAELNIDGQDIMRTSTSEGKGNIVKTKKEVITLENGCICCNLRGDLIREINRIQETRQFDYVLIESTGIAEPQQVAESFCVDPETQALAGEEARMLWQSARLDTCVTVVDAVNFPQYLSSLKRFQDIFKDGLDDTEDPEGEKSISELMVEQVEFANVILLNKVDLVSPKTIKVARELIKTLNPKARVITGSFGKIDLPQILNTHLFDMTEASESPGWLLSLKDGVDASQMGESEEYGVGSFVYRSGKPFHPLRLYSFLKQFFCFAEDWNVALDTSKESGMDQVDGKREKELQKIYGSILRSKGSCWIAGRDEHEIGWHQTGRIIQLSPKAAWNDKANLYEGQDTGAQNGQYQSSVEKTTKDNDAGAGSGTNGYGDRRQELVFIGTDLKPAAIEEELGRCLLTDEEMTSHSTDLPVGTYPDPLQPILVPCNGAQSLFMTVRPGQDQHIRIYPGSLLTIQNLALNMVESENSEASIKAVKVWLDKSDGARHGALLATLRPLAYEQHSMSLSLLPCDERGGEEVTNRRIRLEIIPSRKAEARPDLDWILACEVSIMGNVEPLPYHPATDDEDEGEEEDNEEEETGDDNEGDVSRVGKVKNGRKHGKTKDCRDCEEGP